MALFSGNDIRGIYPEQLNRETVYRIGCYLPGLLGARDIVLGRDPRLSSQEIFSALSQGIRDAGAELTDIGPCCTPSLYFANAFYGFDGSTEPKLRLVVEADTEEKLERRKQELIALILDNQRENV